MKMDEKIDVLNSMVEASLYQKAIGYQTTETKIIENENGIKEKITITKEEPPDLKSAIFWLKNKCPEKWKDEPNDNGSQEKLIKIMAELDAIINED